VAEDIEINRKLLGKMLDRLGYSGSMVTIVNDGKQAAEAVEKEVARFLRRTNRAAAAAAAAIAAVASTAHADEDDSPTPSTASVTASSSFTSSSSSSTAAAAGAAGGALVALSVQPFHLVLMDVFMVRISSLARCQMAAVTACCGISLIFSYSFLCVVLVSLFLRVARHGWSASHAGDPR
jgi:CheY-like chemotaxis protein